MLNEIAIIVEKSIVIAILSFLKEDKGSTGTRKWTITGKEKLVKPIKLSEKMI